MILLMLNYMKVILKLRLEKNRFVRPFFPVGKNGELYWKKCKETKSFFSILSAPTKSEKYWDREVFLDKK